MKFRGHIHPKQLKLLQSEVTKLNKEFVKATGSNHGVAFSFGDSVISKASVYSSVTGNTICDTNIKTYPVCFSVDLNFNGYEIIGMIESGVPDNHVTLFNGENPEVFADYSMKCTFSHSTREYKRIIIINELYKAESGYHFIASCHLKDFLGVDIYRALSTLNNILDIIESECKIDLGSDETVDSLISNNGDLPYIDTFVYLCYCTKLIEDDGKYVKVESGKEKESTKHRAYMNAISNEFYHFLDNTLEDIFSEKILSIAAETCKMFYETEVADDLYSKIKNALKKPFCQASGLIACAPWIYMSKKHSLVPSYKAGEVIETEAEIIMCKNVETRYGKSILYKFKDELGNIFTWFSSKRVPFYPEERVHLTGTVTGFTVFAGTTEIRLKSCVIESRLT